MRDLYDSLDFGIVLLDTRGRIQRCNRWLREHARLAQEPLGLALGEALGAPISTRLTAAIQQALERGHSSRLSSALHPTPLPLFASDGGLERMRQAVDIVSVLTPSDVRQCLLQVRDMTESYRREEMLRRQANQLQESEQRLAATLENAPIGMALSTLDGRWTYVNRALCDMLGESAASLLQGATSTRVHPEDLAKHPQHERFFEEQVAQSSRIEERWRHRDGSVVWVRVTATRVFDAVRKANYVIQQIEPIGERKRKEQEVAEALLEKETLLREVYHRVKNNLQVIQSLLNLKRNSLSDEAAREALAETAERVRSMSLVHEKLYQSSQLSAIDLGEYLRDLLSQLVDALGPRGERVDVTFDVDAVQADLNTAIPFGLIVTELVSNSLKHAFPDLRGGHLHVALKATADGAELEVTDDGVGMERAIRAGRPGSLGLKLVESLARQLDTHLTVLPGPGASFRLTFRRLRGRSQAVN